MAVKPLSLLISCPKRLPLPLVPAWATVRVIDSARQKPPRPHTPHAGRPKQPTQAINRAMAKTPDDDARSHSLFSSLSLSVCVSTLLSMILHTPHLTCWPVHQYKAINGYYRVLQHFETPRAMLLHTHHGYYRLTTALNPKSDTDSNSGN